MRFQILLFLSLCHISLQAVTLNEIVADNETGLTGQDGEFPDWIELYNPSGSAVDLTGWHLTDNIAELNKWTLPDIRLKSQETLLIRCSGKDLKTGELHTNFRLSRQGEFLALIQSNGIFADSLTFPELPGDHSFGRLPDGTGEFMVFSQPSPDASNQTTAASVVIDMPECTPVPGIYPGAVEVVLSVQTADTEIYYTLDGTIPDQNSTHFVHPILLNESGVIRAIAVKNGKRTSDVKTMTFLANEDPALCDLPVMSLITEPDDLWNDGTGIYANPMKSGRDWERPVSVEYFTDADEGFAVNAGLRIHGGASRMPGNSDKKSFRLYFRSEYGPSRLGYALISDAEQDAFDRIVLRAGYNDAWTHWLAEERELTTYLRDPLTRELFMQMNQPASHGIFVHLFLNGEYWGLYNLCERYDDDFCDARWGGGDWDVVKPGPDSLSNAIEASEGSLSSWNEFEHWFRTTNLSTSAAYDSLQEFVDIDNFLDFYILNFYAQNYDWPRHNWYAARKKVETGKWYFLPWDSEYAFGSGKYGYSHSLNMWDEIEKQRNYPLPLLYSKLKSNPRFRDAAAARFNELFETVLSQDEVMQTLNALTRNIETGIDLEADRWGNARLPDRYDAGDWEEAVAAMARFIEQRQGEVEIQLVNEGFITQESVLPEPWEMTDVGNVSIAGTVNYSNGTFSVFGSGVDIWAAEDGFCFVWQEVAGDVDIRARVVSLADVHEWSKAGVMIRESLNADSKNALSAMTPDKATFQTRTQNGNESSSTKLLNLSAPYWVRLVRKANRLTGYASGNGSSWKKIDQATVSMGETVYAGLAVTSHEDGTLCRAVFDEVIVNGVMSAVSSMYLVGDFELLPNFPNPFNPMTTVSFRLPVQSEVKLSVYNVRGQWVEDVIQAVMPSGMHSMQWNGSKHPSGVYSIRIKAGTWCAVRKVNLLR